MVPRAGSVIQGRHHGRHARHFCTRAITKTGYQRYGGSPSAAGTFRYTGARIDAETNVLYDFRARMYSRCWGGSWRRTRSARREG